MNRRDLLKAAAAAPVAPLALSLGSAEPLELDVDARSAGRIALDVDEWRGVPRATMELDMHQLGGFVLRVGDDVRFETPILSAEGVVTAVHALHAMDNILYSLGLAEVRSFEINDLGERNGHRFGPANCALHVNGEDRSGTCHRVLLRETRGGSAPRDALALATERLELKREREALDDGRQRLNRGEDPWTV